MYALNVIPEELTKWHIQLMHILALQGLNFSDLSLHVLWLKFGYVFF
jgi:hypothetical protein